MKSLYIRLVQDIDSLNGFDRTYIDTSECKDSLWPEVDWDNFEVYDDIYQLTEEGIKIYKKWKEDSRVGYDLCTGRMKGVCLYIGGTESSLWDYLTSNHDLAVKVEW